MRLYILLIIGLMTIPLVSSLDILDLYVEKITPTKIKIIFSVDTPSNYTLKYGTDRGMENAVSTYAIKYTEKVIELDNLFPDKKYYYNITVCDYYKNCKTYGMYTFTIDEPQSSTDSIQISRDWDVMNKGPHTIESDTSDSNINRVEFNILKNLDKTSFSINKLNTRPSGKKYLKTKVYRYFNISKNNIPNSAIRSINILFSVSRKWMNQNSMDEDELTFFTYDDGWIPVVTTLMSKDGNFIYYSVTIDYSEIIAIGQYDWPTTSSTTSSSTSTSSTSTSSTTISSTDATSPTTNIDSTTPHQDSATTSITTSTSITTTTAQPTTAIEEESPLLILQQNESSITIIITIFAMVLSLSAAAFIFSINRDKKHDHNVLLFKEKSDIDKILKNINRHMKKQNKDELKWEYNRLMKAYKILSRTEKDKHYPKIEKILEKISKL